MDDEVFKETQRSRSNLYGFRRLKWGRPPKLGSVSVDRERAAPWSLWDIALLWIAICSIVILAAVMLQYFGYFL